MRILFARHGNTFGPNDPVVWVGAGTDLPLVEKGLLQAHKAAAYLADRNWRPTAVLAATLQRTTRFAQIVCEDLGLPAPRAESRLNEIHYGPWEAATTEQITADPVRQTALEQWQRADVWPVALNWQTTQADVTQALTGLLRDVAAGLYGDQPLIVSSNGILRFAPRILGVNSATSYQLKTGAMGCLEQTAHGWEMAFWGTSP